MHVKDNGSGISKDKQKSLFKRFYEGVCWDFLAAGEVKYMICRVYRHTSIVNSVYHGKEEKTSAQKGLL